MAERPKVTDPPVEWSRVYLPEECGPDGYPLAWHRGLRWWRDGDRPLVVEPLDSPHSVGIKDVVRAEAGDRCVRCGHPYSKGAGQWSACDEQCAHWGPSRYADGRSIERDLQAVDRGILVREGARIEAEWRILTVHHLTGEKRDCRWWNLAALCQRCHLQVQGKVRMDRRWPHEHSEWFKPYVAGYYAAVYLGEDVSREQAVKRMDELLALEHRQLALDGEEAAHV